MKGLFLRKIPTPGGTIEQPSFRLLQGDLEDNLTATPK